MKKPANGEIYIVDFNKIKELLKDECLTQVWLSKQTKLKIFTIKNILAGRTCTFNNICLIANALKKDINFFKKKT